MNKHAIILHLYYTDLWNEFKEKLDPIINNGNVDLYITLTVDDISIKSEVEKITSNVFILPNKGLDIGAFIFILDKIKDLDYSTITKIHTKKSLHHGRDPKFGNDWRKKVVNSLIGSTKIYNDVINVIENDPICLVGSKDYLFDFGKDFINIPYHYKDIKETLDFLNLKIKEEKISNSVKFSKSGRFFAGSMFSTSHKYLKEIFSKSEILDLYEKLPIGYTKLSYAHALERIFGFYLEESGGNFYVIE